MCILVKSSDLKNLSSQNVFPACQYCSRNRINIGEAQCVWLCHRKRQELGSNGISSHLASFAAVFYLVMFFQGILVICIERFVRISSSHGTLFVFFVGGLFACINVITTRNNLYVALNFRLFTVPLIGIIFLFFGVTLFSRELPPGENRPTLGRQQPSMGLVVSIITVPLVGIEIVLLIATFNSISTDEINESLTHVEWLLLKTEKSIYVCAKQEYAETPKRKPDFILDYCLFLTSSSG